jgi:predicted MFS family arabinose efflux permease
MLRAFEPHEQGRASGMFGMGVVLAPALGPSIGGVLVQLFGWRSIFFMVVPFCLASMWLAMKFVPVTGPGGATAQRGSTLDWRGLLLGAIGTICLLNGLVELHRGGAIAGVLLAGAVLALVAFIAWQRRLKARGGAPLMDLALFGYRTFAMGSIVAFIYGTALFGSTYLLPVYMQLALRLSPSYVGTILLPAGLILAVTIPLVGRLADRQAHPPARVHRAGSAGNLIRADGHRRPGHGHLGSGGVGHPRPHRAGLHPSLPEPGLHALAAQGLDPARVERDQLPANARRRSRGEPVRHPAGVAHRRAW